MADTTNCTVPAGTRSSRDAANEMCRHQLIQDAVIGNGLERNVSDDKPIFHVRNKHTASSGEPPQINGNKKGKYFSYFENEFGEQSIFVYDYETQTGTLYMGDAGWDEPVTITKDTKSDLILNEVEGVWLGACWLATSRDPR